MAMFPTFVLVTVLLSLSINKFNVVAFSSSTSLTAIPNQSKIKGYSPKNEKEDENNDIVDVAIVGAGPCGLALAHSLLNRGYKIRILERRSSFRPVGSAVFLHPFALNSLREISPTVAQNVLDVATRIGTITVKSLQKSENKATFPFLDDSPKVFGNPFVTIRFWDLLQALRKGLPEDVFLFGSDVEGWYERSDGKLDLRYTHTITGEEDEEKQYRTKEVVNAKMVIDASGIRSNLRKQIEPESKSVPFCKAYMAVLPAEKANPIIRDGSVDTMTERELGFLVGDTEGMTLATLENGDVWWTYTGFNDAMDSSLSTQELAERAKDRLPPFAVKLIRNTIDPIETVIADLPVSWNWGEGMVTLMGDAAHAQLPALGLGCSAAFADIEELVKQIDSQGLTPDALRGYQRWRMPQVAALQTASRFTYGTMRNLGKL